MKSWTNIFRVMVLMLGLIILSFNVLLYNFCERQKNQISAMSEEQKAELQITSSKFKSQQDLITQLGEDLEVADGKIKDQNDALTTQKDALAAQKDALLQEVGKRRQAENISKNVQRSLIDIKAEADAIKEDMKGWQKDYVTILAQLEKKMDDNQEEMKSLETNLIALNIPALKESISSLKADVEKMSQTVDNSSSAPAPAVEKKIERSEVESPPS